MPGFSRKLPLSTRIPGSGNKYFGTRNFGADQHLLRSYKRFERNRDLKLSEVRYLEYRRTFTTRRAIFTSSSRSSVRVADSWRSIHRAGL